MTDWATFAGFAGVVLVALLLLSHASRHVFDDADADAGATATADDTRRLADDASPVRADVTADSTPSRTRGAPVPERDDADTTAGSDSTTDDAPATANGGASTATGDDLPIGVRYGPAPPSGATDEATDRETEPVPQMSTAALLANVALSQGAFGLLLVLGAWITEIPASAFGLGAGSIGASALALGTGLGVALYAANELGSAVGERFGLGGSEELRAALAPDSVGGWLVLLFGVLPVIAGFEELLFRGALVGVLAAGFGVSPWLLAALSSVAFALGHGAQGPAGVVVTGLLGFVLAAAYVLSGSLLLVVVAHYLVNALEFVVHEGLGVEWTGRR